MNRQPEHLSVEAHQVFRQSISPPVPDPWDMIDELAAEPILDHIPARRGHGKIKRVLEILDRLEGGNHP